MEKAPAGKVFTSVFNDVLGPVMRGPSSSHTAGSYHIACIARQLLGTEPVRVRIHFDSDGSYGNTYVQQGADQAFVTGLMGWKQTDPIFTKGLETAKEKGVHFDFEVGSIPEADHPNYVILEIDGTNDKHLHVEAKSTGGGTFRIVKVDGAEVELDGKSHTTLISVADKDRDLALQLLKEQNGPLNFAGTSACEGATTLTIFSPSPFDAARLWKFPAIQKIRQAKPVYFTQKSTPPFSSAAEMVGYAQDNSYSLGEAVLEYEKKVLGISEKDAVAEMLGRYEVMRQSVADGLRNETVNMLLLEPTAATIMDAVQNGRAVIGGIHSKAGAAAMAVMHTCNSRGVVCAAPTGGAAGTLPGILTTLADEFSLSDRQVALMMFAAGGVGLILAIRGTFAAEVAGCQVEIGAAGAMGAAAVVEFGGGTARQACDAAAISFQNTMGSVCDLVQGICELPCHSRNAVAASSAFTNADLVVGGYMNPIDLDETIDAVYSSGIMLPSELRCTARGGLAAAPSAKALGRIQPGTPK